MSKRVCGKSKVVLFWTDALKVSTHDVDMVREEDRNVGSCTVIKFGSKLDPAIVHCISGKCILSSLDIRGLSEVCVEVIVRSP